MQHSVDTAMFLTSLLIQQIQQESVRNVFQDMSRLAVDCIGKVGFGYDFNSIQNAGETDALLNAAHDTVKTGIGNYAVFTPLFMWKSNFGFFKQVQKVNNSHSCLLGVERRLFPYCCEQDHSVSQREST